MKRKLLGLLCVCMLLSGCGSSSSKPLETDPPATEASRIPLLDVLREKLKLPDNAVMHRAVVIEHYVGGIVFIACLKGVPRGNNGLGAALTIEPCGIFKKERFLALKYIEEGKCARCAAHQGWIISEIPAFHNACGSKLSCDLILIVEDAGGRDIRHGGKLVGIADLHLCPHLASALLCLLGGDLKLIAGANVGEPIVPRDTGLSELDIQAAVFKILHQAHVERGFLHVFTHALLRPITVAVRPADELCIRACAADTLLDDIHAVGKIFTAAKL